MKKLFPIISLFVLCSFSISSDESTKSQFLDELISQKKISIEAKSMGGLGKDNLMLRVKNLVNSALKIKIKPGTYFKSEDPKAQDLVIVEAPELALEPSNSSDFMVQGYCTQRHNYSPGDNEVYVYNGLAKPKLKGMCDILVDTIFRSGRQSNIWAVTNGNTYFDDLYAKDSSQLEKFNKLADYLYDNTGARIKVYVYNEDIHGYLRNDEKIFSWRGVLNFVVPKPTKMNFKTLDKDGNVIHTYFKNRTLNSGLKYFEFGINDIYFSKDGPEYTTILETADGKRIIEQKINANTVLERATPHKKVVKVTLEIKKDVGPAYINLYDENGELYMVMSRLKNLKQGFFTYNLNVEYLGEEDQEFEIRFEDSRRNMYHSQWTDGR